jgi:hypothetical protein
VVFQTQFLVEAGVVVAVLLVPKHNSDFYPYSWILILLFGMRDDNMQKIVIFVPMNLFFLNFFDFL